LCRLSSWGEHQRKLPGRTKNGSSDAGELKRGGRGTSTTFGGKSGGRGGKQKKKKTCPVRESGWEKKKVQGENTSKGKKKNKSKIRQERE